MSDSSLEIIDSLEGEEADDGIFPTQQVCFPDASLSSSISSSLSGGFHHDWCPDSSPDINTPENVELTTHEECEDDEYIKIFTVKCPRPRKISTSETEIRSTVLQCMSETEHDIKATSFWSPQIVSADGEVFEEPLLNHDETTGCTQTCDGSEPVVESAVSLLDISESSTGKDDHDMQQSWNPSEVFEKVEMRQPDKSPARATIMTPPVVHQKCETPDLKINKIDLTEEFLIEGLNILTKMKEESNTQPKEAHCRRDLYANCAENSRNRRVLLESCRHRNIHQLACQPSKFSDAHWEIKTKYGNGPDEFLQMRRLSLNTLRTTRLPQGFISWLCNKSFIQTFTRSAMNTFNCILLALDPDMASYIGANPDLTVLVVTSDANLTSASRRGFRKAFPYLHNIEVKTISMTVPELPIQPLGFESGLLCAQRKIDYARTTRLIPQNSLALAVASVLVEITPLRWHSCYCVLLDDPSMKLSLHAYSQTTPVPNDYVEQAKLRTADEYSVERMGLDTTVGDVIELLTGVPSSDWVQKLTDVSCYTSLEHTVQSLAGMYKRYLNDWNSTRPQRP